MLEKVELMDMYESIYNIKFRFFFFLKLFYLKNKLYYLYQQIIILYKIHRQFVLREKHVLYDMVMMMYLMYYLYLLYMD